jgi:hypothetical protein
MSCVKKCVFIHISTFSFTDDVRRHNQLFGTQRPRWRPSWDHPILGVPTSARWRPLWVCACSPYLRLDNGSDTISCDDPFFFIFFFFRLQKYSLAFYFFSYHLQIHRIKIKHFLGQYIIRLFTHINHCSMP